MVAFIGIVILSAVLVVNLYHLQINRHEDYQTCSNDNRIKLVPIPPSRGLIYDRKGTLLAENRTIYQLEIVPEKVTDLPDVLNELREIVDLTDEDIANYEKERRRSRRFTSIPLKTLLNQIQVARFPVNQYRFPGTGNPKAISAVSTLPRLRSDPCYWLCGEKINDKDVERLDKRTVCCRTMPPLKISVSWVLSAIMNPSCTAKPAMRKWKSAAAAA